MGVLWPEIVLYYNEYQNQDICLCTLVCFKNMISGKNSQIHFPIRIIREGLYHIDFCKISYSNVASKQGTDN